MSDAAILQARAQALAAPADDLAADYGEDHLVFELRGERYAVDARCVREVLRMPKLFPVPGAPPEFSGVIAVRGDVLPVVDLALALGLPGTDEAPQCMLVLGEERAEFGVATTGHVFMAAVPASLEAPPDWISTPARAWLKGVTADGRVVLDGAVLLADARLYST